MAVPRRKLHLCDQVLCACAPGARGVGWREQRKRDEKHEAASTGLNRALRTSPCSSSRVPYRRLGLGAERGCGAGPSHRLIARGRRAEPAPPACWPSRAESFVRGERAGRPEGASAWGGRSGAAGAAGRGWVLGARCSCCCCSRFCGAPRERWGRACRPERGPAQPRLPRAGGLASLKARFLLISLCTCASVWFFVCFFTLKNWGCAVVTVSGVILYVARKAERAK